MNFTSMVLSHWPFLLLAPLIPLGHRWWRKRNDPPRVLFSVPQGTVRPALMSPMTILLGLRYLSLTFFLLALARPQLVFRQIERETQGIDIMMVMDFSRSMEIEDLSENSRFDVAKKVMQDFIRGRQNDRIGFVIFSGEALTLAPPTLDYGLVLSSLQEAQIGVLKDGTAIGDGLATAVSRLRSSNAKSKVIILLTDGENNVGQVDPATAGEMAQGYGIRVYTIAIGREGRVKLAIRANGPGSPIVNYQWFDNALNPELLQKISALTNGKFYRVTDESALQSVFKEINQLERTDVKSKERVQYEELFRKPLLWGIFLLLLERLLALVWWRTYP